jgi:hypothetical protein
MFIKNGILINMKKHIFLFAFVFAFGLLGLFNFNINKVNAFDSGCRTTSGFSTRTGNSCTPSNLPPGCASTQGFSPTTGQVCNSFSLLPAGCTSAQGFSPTTGQSCSVSNLPPGCTSSQGFSPTTGQSCGTFPTFPPGCFSNFGFSVTTGQSCGMSSLPPPFVSVTANPSVIAPGGSSTINWSSSGSGGAQSCSFSPSGGLVSASGGQAVFPSSTTSYTVTCTDSSGLSGTASAMVTVQPFSNGCTSTQGFSPTTGQPCGSGTVTFSIPVVSGVNGPQSLSVNQQGSWTVSASSPNGGNLSYSVTWGDEQMLGIRSGSASSIYFPQQSASFTHTYSRTGTFAPIFTVTNNNGQSAQTTLSVNVVNGPVIMPTPAVITVFSPNGGETWVKGTTQNISWQDSASVLTHTITLVPFNVTPSCIVTPGRAVACPSFISYLTPVTIANIQGSSFNWFVGQTLDNSTVPDGTYTIQICQTGTTFCGSSNNFFNVVSGMTPTATVSAYLNNIRSTAPQLVPVGSSGATNITEATYVFVSIGGASTITELKFSVNAPNSVSFITVNGVVTPVVNGVADITGLNISVPNGGSGSSQDVFVSYPGIGVNGVSSGTTSSIALNYIKYFSGGMTSIITPYIPAPTMTLVDSINTTNLSISPASASIRLGSSATFQALFNNCPAGAQCFVPPLPVVATWVSSDPNIATVAYRNSCPSGSYCFAAPDNLTAVVTGVSTGFATITATNSAGVTASANVTIYISVFAP